MRMQCRRMGTGSYKNIPMPCLMKLSQNQNESINSILEHGHVVRKDYFVLSAASLFPYVILCRNLLVVQGGTI